MQELRQRRPNARRRRRAQRERRHRLVFAIFAVVAILAVCIVAGIRLLSRDGPATLSEEAAPERYHIVYRVTAPGSEGLIKEHYVERPYLGKVIEHRDGAIVTGALSNEDGTWQYVSSSGEPGWSLLQRGRFAAVSDFRPVPVLRYGVRHGLATIRGADEVLGRPCTVVRTGAPLGSRLEEPSRQSTVDLCVDRAGLVLREEWTLDGELARRSVATALELEPRFSADVFDPSPVVAELPPGAGGTPLVTDLSPEIRAGLPIGLGTLDGFRFDGGSSLIQLVEGVSLGTVFVERYRRGPDLIEVSQGPLTEGDQQPGRALTVGGRRAYLDVYLTRAVLTIPLPDDRYVRVRSSDPALALEAAEELQARRAVAGEPRP